MPDLTFDVLRQVTLARGVLDQDHLADADHPTLTIAGGYLHPGVEIDDVLPTRGRVPVDVMLGLRLTENDTGGRQALGKLAASSLLDPSTSMSRKCDWPLPSVYRLCIRMGVSPPTL